MEPIDTHPEPWDWAEPFLPVLSINSAGVSEPGTPAVPIPAPSRPQLPLETHRRDMGLLPWGWGSGQGCQSPEGLSEPGAPEPRGALGRPCAGGGAGRRGITVGRRGRYHLGGPGRTIGRPAGEGGAGSPGRKRGRRWGVA